MKPKLLLTGKMQKFTPIFTMFMSATKSLQSAEWQDGPPYTVIWLLDHNAPIMQQFYPIKQSGGNIRPWRFVQYFSAQHWNMITSNSLFVVSFVYQEHITL